VRGNRLRLPMRKRPSGRKMPKGWAQTRRRVIARDSGTCYLCGKAGANSADHIIPHALGGSDEMVNLRAAHMACNERKGAAISTGVPRPSRFG
jgi:5-methylcytosine-specific restriction endonuclease McrA